MCGVCIHLTVVVQFKNTDIIKINRHYKRTIWKCETEKSCHVTVLSNVDRPRLEMWCELSEKSIFCVMCLSNYTIMRLHSGSHKSTRSQVMVFHVH
jgi:hypothetical protein